MKSIIRFWSVLIVALLFIVANVNIQAQQQEKKFRVGLILPLSGGLADYGAALRHGFELAAEDYPELFNNLELVYEDSKFEEKTALTAFYSLEQKGGVDLYHVWGVSPNASVLPVSNAKRRPVISETSMMSAGKGRPYVVIASRTGYSVAENLMKVFVEKGWKHVAIIITQIPYYTDIADALVEFGNKSNVKVDLIDQVPPSEQDFKTVLTRLKAKEIDAFGPLLLGDQIPSFCAQAKALHYSMPIFGAHIHNSVDLMNKCLPLSEGALLPGVIVEESFRERYAAKYGNEQRIDSAAGSYETAKMIAQLFGKENSSKLSAEQIIERFKSVNQSDSSIGSYRYAESAEGGKAIRFTEIVLTFKNGQIVPY